MKTNLMNRLLPRVMLAGACAGLALAFSHAEDKPADVGPKAGKPALSKPVPVMVPFLGVVLAPVDESLAAQLDLPEGVGVLVRAVLQDGPAAKAGVRQHDVLHYFNDQLLVNEPQLQTLVQQAGIGTEVTLKLLRKGRSETIVVKLGSHEESESAESTRWRPRGFGFEGGPGGFGAMMPPRDGTMFNIPLNGEGFATRVRELSERMKHLEGKPDQIREEVERFQTEMKELAKRTATNNAAAERAAVEKKRAEFDRKPGTLAVGQTEKGGIRVEVFTDEGRVGGGQGAVTATTDVNGNVTVTHTNNTRMVWNDGAGSGELLIQNGRKKLTVKDRDGKEIFTGPVDTDEQRRNLPGEVRERLERLEKDVKVNVNHEGKDEDA